jgi:hypothetical protein
MYDEEGTWVADFESVHGDGTWSKWIDEWTSITEWVDNEVRQNMPALSGAED